MHPGSQPRYNQTDGSWQKYIDHNAARIHHWYRNATRTRESPTSTSNNYCCCWHCSSCHHKSRLVGTKDCRSHLEASLLQDVSKSICRVSQAYEPDNVRPNARNRATIALCISSGIDSREYCYGVRWEVRFVNTVSKSCLRVGNGGALGRYLMNTCIPLQTFLHSSFKPLIRSPEFRHWHINPLRRWPLRMQ